MVSNPLRHLRSVPQGRDWVLLLAKFANFYFSNHISFSSFRLRDSLPDTWDSAMNDWSPGPLPGLCLSVFSSGSEKGLRASG